jgi:2-keto-4-pentenoate hydratase/2-oxohepta-3-ene-1,7-dioic acid hydratase in catechol pathway
VKLGRFTPHEWPGHTVRLGVVVDDADNPGLGRRTGSETLLDVASALAVLLVDHDGAEPTRAADYALAALPGRTVDLLGTWNRSRALVEEVVTAVEQGDIGLADQGPLGPLAWPRSAVQVLAPIDRPPSIRDFFAFETHMKNALGNLGLDVPEAWYEAPSHYVTRSASIFGPDEPGIWPAYTEMLDFELEFGIVIGRCGRDISVDRAWDYIAGFTIYNDLSCRDVQRREMATRVGPAKTKGFDGGTGLGPYLVTADEFTSPFDGGMRAYVNDELWSEGRAGSIYWSVEQIIAHASAGETLYPGDVLGSGTVGTGAGIEIDRWIRPGDVVRLEIDGIGALETTISRALTSSGST